MNKDVYTRIILLRTELLHQL